MLIDGEKTRVTKWIHGDLCVARVEVDAILPAFDPSEPYLEPEVVRCPLVANRSLTATGTP